MKFFQKSLAGLVALTFLSGSLFEGVAQAKTAKQKKMSQMKKKKADKLKRTQVDAWTKLFQSDSQAARADRLFKEGYLNLAFADYLDLWHDQKIQNGDLAKLGELALILGRTAEIDREAKGKGALPATIKAAVAWEAVRSGDNSRAENWMPSSSEIEGFSSNARYVASHVAATLEMAQGKSGAAKALLLRATRVEGFDPALSYLQRARISFNEGNLEESLEELLNVPRSSPSWYEGLLVAAWSSYRLKDYNLALGVLMSATSPYLTDKFGPEFWILQAATYYRLCYYESASRSLKVLKAHFGGLSTSIQRVRRASTQRLKSLGWVLNVSRGEIKPPVDISQSDWNKIVDGIVSQEAFLFVDRAFSQGDTDLEFLKQVSARVPAGLANSYKKSIDRGKYDLSKWGHKIMMKRLGEMESQVKEVLENALAVEVEINTRLRDRLLTGKIPQLAKIQIEADVKDGYEFWPFQSEYWRDETGSYMYATVDACGVGK